MAIVAIISLAAKGLAFLYYQATVLGLGLVLIGFHRGKIPACYSAYQRLCHSDSHHVENEQPGWGWGEGAGSSRPSITRSFQSTCWIRVRPYTPNTGKDMMWRHFTFFSVMNVLLISWVSLCDALNILLFFVIFIIPMTRKGFQSFPPLLGWMTFEQLSVDQLAFGKATIVQLCDAKCS